MKTDDAIIIVVNAVNDAIAADTSRPNRHYITVDDIKTKTVRELCQEAGRAGDERVVNACRVLMEEVTK